MPSESQGEAVTRKEMLVFWTAVVVMLTMAIAWLVLPNGVVIA